MLDDKALDTLFRNARSQNGWLDQAVSDDQVRAVYDLLKWGPTSMNTSPARFLFLRTEAAKARLKPFLNPGNVDKCMTAPVLAVIAYDEQFYEHLPRLLPHNQNAINVFKGEEKKALADITAFRNGTLQGAYLIIAARALGLECGPMSGFNNAGVDKEFFTGTTVRSNFLCGIGYGNLAKVMARSPRLAFDEACKLL